MRKPNDERESPEGKGDDARTAHLPARRKQGIVLLDAPREGLKIVIERSAGVYFSTCRRLAELLNRNG